MSRRSSIWGIRTAQRGLPSCGSWPGNGPASGYSSVTFPLREMPTLVLFWIWFCAYLNCAGWALSALHQLNAGGYAVALALGLGAWLVWRRHASAPAGPVPGVGHGTQPAALAVPGFATTP